MLLLSFGLRMPCKNNFSIYQDPKLNRVVFHVQINTVRTQEISYLISYSGKA